MDPSMTVPVLRLKNGLPGHSRQRWVIVGCLAPDWTLSVPQRGHRGPVGQNTDLNHIRAASSVGNLRATWTRLTPSR